LGAVYFQHLAIANVLRGPDYAENRRNAVLAGRHGSVAQDPASLNHDGAGYGEQRRPRRHRGVRHENIALVQSTGFVQGQQNSRRTDRHASRTAVAHQRIWLVGLHSMFSEESASLRISGTIRHRR
jgi:hypothetical protein